MDEICNKFNLAAKALEKNLDVLQFMSPSRLKQLVQLSETLIQQTIPRLNQYLQSCQSASTTASFDQSALKLAHSANPYQLHLERLSLLLLDMLKQLMRYASHKVTGFNENHKVLYDKEVALIGQRIIFYMIQGVKISKQEIEAQLTQSDVFSMQSVSILERSEDSPLATNDRETIDSSQASTNLGSNSEGKDGTGLKGEQKYSTFEQTMTQKVQHYAWLKSVREVLDGEQTGSDGAKLFGQQIEMIDERIKAVRSLCQDIIKNPPKTND